MRIAILLSTYNGEKYLNEQLKSIKNQTMINNLTVYARDDGSSDGTLKILNKWRKELDIRIILGQNCGPAQSFWSLLVNKEIKADYYAFCDQDDLWDSDKIESACFYLENNPDCHLYCCNCRLVDSNNNIQSAQMLDCEPELTYKRLFICGVAQGCSMVFSDVLRNLIINSNITCIPMHDIITMLYAKGCGSIYWDPHPRFSYRQHLNNVVAKENKGFIKNLSTTFWNWKNSSANSMSDVAKELIMNLNNISEEDLLYLQKVADYKHNFNSRVSLFFAPKPTSAPYSAVRSYMIRLVLKLL